MRLGRASDPKSPFLCPNCAEGVRWIPDPPNCPFSGVVWPQIPRILPQIVWGGAGPVLGRFFGFFPFREVFSFPEKTFPRFLRFCFFSSGPKKAKKKAKGAGGGTPGTPRGGVRPPAAPLLLAWGCIATETPSYHDSEPHIAIETPRFSSLTRGSHDPGKRVSSIS